MERLEVLLDVRLPSISKPTVSLFFGLLISLVSVVLLLTAMCSQTWAVRQETVMLQQQATQGPSHGSDATKMDSSDPQDIDSRVQIKVPVEVPSLQVMLERNKEAAPQFYEGRLNELYTERLNELTREAQSRAEPHSSPLLYKPSVKLKTKRDNEVTSISIQDASGIQASIDKGDQKIKITARDPVPPNEGGNATAHEIRARIGGITGTVFSQSFDLNSGRTLYSGRASSLKHRTAYSQITNSSLKHRSRNRLENTNSNLSNSSELNEVGNYFNTSQNKNLVRVVRSYGILQRALNSSREKIVNLNQLPLPYVKILRNIYDCLQLCSLENRKLESIFNKFRKYMFLSKLSENISSNAPKSQNFKFTCSDLLPSPNIRLNSSGNVLGEVFPLKHVAEFRRIFSKIFTKIFHPQLPNVGITAIIIPSNEVEEEADFDFQVATQPDFNASKLLLDGRTAMRQDISGNKLFFNSRVAPSQRRQQRWKSFGQKLLIVKQAERRRRSPREEFLRFHGTTHRRSSRRRPETSKENLHLLREGLWEVNSGLARLKESRTGARMKSILPHREKFSQQNSMPHITEVWVGARKRFRRSPGDAPREPTDLKYRVCLWRVCITATRQRGNASTLCWSVLSSTAPSGGSSASLTSSPAALISSLRYASAAVVAATALLCLASSIALRAFLLERHAHKLSCHNAGAPAAVQPLNAATPVQGPAPDSTVVIKSPSLNSMSSSGAQHRNFQFKSVNDAAAQSTDEVSSSATETSGLWLASQQHDQFLLPVASALFAVSGITMGGGVFKFCSAMTEKSITSPNDGGHFSSMSSHLSTTLHWPLLLAANCVVGCFLAALAIGYTFFLTWDKQILNFLNTGTSNDNLIVNQPYDRPGSDRKSLCDRCKTKSSTIIEEVAKSLEDNSLAPYQCCHVEYCCNNPTIRHHKSHCNPHMHDVHFTQSLRKQPCTKMANSYHYPARCSQCLNDRDPQFGGSSRMPVSSPRTPNNICNAKFEESRAKFWSTDLHANYNPHIHRSMDRYHSQPNERHHHEEFFRAPVDSVAMQKVVSEAERHVINVCDDPICQREQLRFHRPQSFAEERAAQQLENTVQLSRPKELIKYNDNSAANVRWKPSINSKEVFSDGEVEHMYSNFIMPNNAPSFSFPRQLGDRFRIDNKASSCSTQCACDQCSVHLSMGAAQADWSRSYIHMSHKERKSRQYFVDTEKSTASAFQSPHQSLSSLRSNNYSTLPAKFSAKDSFFFQEGRTNHANREFKSCLNITETSVSSFDLIKNSHGLINENAKQNSSAPSLKAKIDEFDKRKLVKTVKFVTPDDDDSDSDSDYYIKKPTQNSINKIRRDFLAADGSSPIRELCGNSPLYR